MANRQEREKQERKRTSARTWSQQSQRGEATCVRFPQNVEEYKLVVGTHKVDFMTYLVGINAAVGRKINPRADLGMEHFELTYGMHRIPTANGIRYYACRKSVFGDRCAGCDWMVRNGNTADPNLVNQIRESTRHLWIVNDKPGNVKNPLKILDTNHWNKKKGFGEQMASVINTLDDGEEPFGLVGGYTATLTVEEETFPGGKYTLASRIDLRKHDYDYPESVLMAAPNLDDCLVDPGYDFVRDLLEMGSSPPQNEEAGSTKTTVPVNIPPAKAKEPPIESNGKPSKPASSSSYTPKLGDWVKYKNGDCTVRKIAADGSLTLEDYDGDLLTAISPGEVTKLDSKDDQPKSAPAPEAKAAKTTAKKPVVEEEPDDVDEGEDSDDMDLEEFEENSTSQRAGTK